MFDDCVMLALACSEKLQATQQVLTPSSKRAPLLQKYRWQLLMAKRLPRTQQTSQLLKMEQKKAKWMDPNGLNSRTTQVCT